IILIKMIRPVAALDSLAHRSWNQGWDDAAAVVQQIESVKQASSEDYETKKVETNLLEKTRDVWLKLERRWNNVSFFQRTIVFLTQLAVFIFSVRLIASQMISVGELVALNGYAMMFFGPFVALGHSWQTVQNGITAAAHAEEIFEEPEEIYLPTNAVTPESLKGAVSFNNVSFAYAPTQPLVLENLNFAIKPGQAVALVGESGVGKSTAVSLISGYYFPTTGAVLVDGIDTRKLNLTSLRRQIAVVPQEIALFNDTIGQNIRYGTFAVADEVFKRVVKEAHIDHFVEKFPEKYETVVGERGIKLSVGQKQRVAIARAMLREPAILILDEPTSALGAATEKIVTEALEALMRGRTTFIIAHRLSTVRRADLILVFEKGKIVETGTHEELITRPAGAYRRLYEYQIGLH
ncbi:MAG: ATP-binding cassette domain-containing protein, partial [Patescibacteria group bacterium]